MVQWSAEVKFFCSAMTHQSHDFKSFVKICFILVSSLSKCEAIIGSSASSGLETVFKAIVSRDE